VATIRTTHEDETYSIGTGDVTLGRAWLLVMSDSGAIAHALPKTGRVYIGRGADCDVQIADASVSRRHAALEIGSNIRIQDLGSANGMRVRQQRMRAHESVPIAPGEIVQLGSVLVAVQQGSAYLPPSPRDGATPAQRAMPTLEASTTPRRWIDDGIVVEDPAMRRLFDVVDRVSKSQINLLLLGETGAGKDVVARAIHRASARARGPFIKVGCATVSVEELDQDLFGTARGAPAPGLLEQAEGGTVFLDEVGELPLALQAKLARIVEERAFIRPGARSPTPVDVRFVAATHRDLQVELGEGRFRSDLFFRLNGITLVVPPLRERIAEIEGLAKLFAARGSADLRRSSPPVITRDALTALQRHVWPGNVRELRNVIESAVVLCGGAAIEPGHLTFAPASADVSTARSSSVPPPAAAPGTAGAAAGGAGALRRQIEALERQRILDALAACSGNQTRAAKLLDMPRRTFLARLETYGIPRPRKGGRDE